MFTFHHSINEGYGCHVQAECESVPRQPYEQNITAVEEQMPLRILGNITLSSGSTPNDTDPVGTVESGQPTDDAGAAPGLGSDVESDSGSFGPAFPGMFWPYLQPAHVCKCK